MAADFLDRDRFICSVCLDLLKDPVALPCGHSYCMECIKNCWDQEGYYSLCKCPQCRETFIPRPVLNRNTMLAEVVEKLKNIELQGAPPDHCYAGPGDVVCDVCTGRKLKAVKSCLVCLASYCETHLQPHHDSAPLRKHKLINATGQLEEKICSHHGKLLEIYCRTDQQCICLLCVMDEHRGHDTVSAAEGRTEKQMELGATQRELQQRLEQREKEAEELRQAVDSVTRSAQAVVEDTEMVFNQMICSIEKRRSELKDEIRAQEQAAVNRAEGLLEQVEQEVAELRKKNTDLEGILYSDDDIHFLQGCQTRCFSQGFEYLPSIFVNQYCSFGDMNKDLSNLKELLEDACRDKVTEISRAVKEVHIVADRDPGVGITPDVNLDTNLNSFLNFPSFPVVPTLSISRVPFSTFLTTYKKRCNRRTRTASSRRTYNFLSPLPSKRRYRSPRTKTTRTNFFL